MAVINVANNTVVANPVIYGGLTGVAASPNGSLVYITAQSINQVQVVSTANNTVVGAINVGSTPVAVAFAPNGSLAYVLNRASNTVSVINTGANAVVATIPVEWRPSGVAVNPSGTRVLVTNNWGTDLSVIDTASNAVIANIPVGSGLSGIAISPNGAYAYATNQNTNSVSVVSLASNTLLSAIPVQNYPNSIAIAPNGARAFVTNGNSSSVSVIDLSSNSVIATLGVGDNPTAIALTPDGAHAEVTNANSYSTSVIDANALSVVGTINRVGIYPAGVAIAPATGSGGVVGVPIPCSYALTASSQNVPYSGGAGAVGVNVAAGATNCNWTAASNASWITLVSGLSGSANGTTGFNVAANPQPAQRTGTFTIAGLTFTVTQDAAPPPPPPSNQPPTGDSVSPSSGTGSSHTFQAAYSDAAGYANLTYAEFVINSSLDGAHTCWIAYNRPNNILYLLNDAGTAFLGPIAAGAAGTLSSSQCTLDGSGSSASGAGNTLTVNLAISFTANYAGAKNSYLLAINRSGLASGWQNRGSWTVPGGAPPPPPPPTVSGNPTADIVSPNAGTGTSQTFQLAGSDPNGFADLRFLEFVINRDTAGRATCWIDYNRPNNLIYLLNDSGSDFLGPITLGVPGTLSNSECTVDAARSSVSGSGNALNLSLALSFSANYAGLKNSYLLAISQSGLDSGWQNRGTWIVPGK
ncbi:MAG: beta-propeller fold lactonase family protein [Bryobacteraceae bacterium]